MIAMRSVRLLTLAVVLLCATLESFGEEKRTFILATGRRDPRIYAIDLREALRPANNNTSNAIVSRALVNPRRLDGTPLGDPANIVLSEDGEVAFVMNHHGGVVNAEFLQHGGRAGIAVMNVHRMIDRQFDDTDARNVAAYNFSLQRNHSLRTGLLSSRSYV